MTLARLAFPLMKPILHRMDAEAGHRITIAMLKRAGGGRASPSPPSLKVDCLGLTFPNPLGLAAGFDKNGEVPDAMLGLGFGFVEAGTVTPRPQTGNERPRLFRLSEDEAVINRMGFNNEGMAAMRRRLEARRAKGGIVGINIGANRDAPDRAADYVKGVEVFADLASFLVINISSPNTPGLRDLEAPRALEDLMRKVIAARGRHSTPLLVKLSPDLAEGDIADTVRVASEHAQGIIVSNTTLTRPALRSLHANEAGGLSGHPLFAASTRLLARLFLIAGGRVPFIGVGGIADAETAWTKIAAGASLIELYTALVYRGPALIPAILEGLAGKLAAKGCSSLSQAVGCDAEAIAHHGLAGT